MAASLVWPVYPLFSGVFPLILGLPLSLAWIVLQLAVAFTAFLILYLTEERDARRAEGALHHDHGGGG